MKNLVDAKWLYEHRDQVVLVDATNNFMVPEEGRQKHDAAHSPGSFHMDLRQDMVGKLCQHGGRDPLPDDMNYFREKLESIGISNDTLVVVYDEDLVPSSRFWWMCKYIGVQNVKVLNGGIQAWKRAGYDLTDQVTPMPEKKGSIQMTINHHMFADIEDIRKAINDPEVGIVDSRTKERYSGIVEPIDKKAGHIPNSINFFFGDIIDPVEGYKSKEFLEEHFAPLKQYKELIFHCGSGVSGSVNIIGLDEIGINSRFYIGSWSDYITYPENTIIVEAEGETK